MAFETISSMNTFTEQICPLAISEQEDFMHRIFDVVHIGVSFTSFEMMIERYSENYSLHSLLNSRMKNEKYSKSFDFPLAKAVSESCGLGNDKETFFNDKLKVIKYMINKGASPKVLNEKYMEYNINIDFLLMFGAINDEIYNYLVALTTN